MTDEAWREMLAGDTPPSMPEWVSSFMDITEPQPTFTSDSPGNLYYHDFSGINNDDTNTIPQTIKLLQNYPNPFNPVTTIEFSIPNAAFVNITVCDIMGRVIKNLVEEHFNAGNYSIKWDAADLPSGIYLITMSSGTHSQTKKALLLK
ncbi:MAG: hypothetical protein DRP89_03555 [Candidatus Neomarinimicrobiota bacterium]|nr:MAG: hypothetical protein DRP89_03555 [Candidatus Neomarinimicrobiota bacterium]